MVSSTFDEFVEHRRALINVINSQGLHPVVMEHDSARPTGTVLDSSLEKVHASEAYIGVIGHRYGAIPADAGNPDGLSLTELEFREARRLNRPILVFIMGDKHPVTLSAVDFDSDMRAKLARFRDEAKRARVYKEFNSLGEFEVAAASAVAELRRVLDAERDGAAASTQKDPGEGGDAMPAAPAFYAQPPYIGSHGFVGRGSGLELLTDWASPAEPHPVLLIEAIGGTGKSMLTWEWTTRHAPAVRADWAGRFWYSFYDKGAIMADFCRHALAYMTGQPLSRFAGRRQPELSDLLLHELRSRPWLLVLDGLERILVAYHRHDAPQLADEDAGSDPASAGGDTWCRDPRAAIRPEDDELLRQLTAAAPSKLLITSRLIPRVLLNTSIQPLPGVLLERLAGLRPSDAEALLRQCGVRGTSQRMQDYLQRHCDCHPLVTGVVAGLVNGHLPARGDFDRWADDPRHGGHLDLGEEDLVQKRNHILNTAIDDLPEDSRHLLGLLSLLPQAVDYATLGALDPFRHLEPSTAGETLERAVRDLERRGLLQYDCRRDRYDLHPVVRAVASHRLGGVDRYRLGEHIVDHFTSQQHKPYNQAETLDDVQNGLTVVRTLLNLGRFEQAWHILNTDLVNSLLYNVEAYPDVYALLLPFFPDGWAAPGIPLTGRDPLITNAAAHTLRSLARFDEAAHLYELLIERRLDDQNWRNLRAGLSNLATTAVAMNRLAAAERHARLGLDLAEALDEPAHIFASRLYLFSRLSTRGAWDEAKLVWDRLGSADPAWSRRTYRAGSAERARVQHFLFPRGELTEADLAKAERVARAARNAQVVRAIFGVRGRWQLANGEYSRASASLQEAVRLARQAGTTATSSEAALALARLHCDRHASAHDDAVRLSAVTDPPHLELARLWQALGDTTRAVQHATAAYRYAWADGEPYVRRHALDNATLILRELGATVPALRPYDDRRETRKPWERRVVDAIEKIRQRTESPPL
jgi:tetratricopeptide (TPR) repeat protein